MARGSVARQFRKWRQSKQGQRFAAEFCSALDAQAVRMGVPPELLRVHVIDALNTYPVQGV